MGKRIKSNIQRSRTQRNLEQLEGNIKGRETSTFTGSAKDPFNAPTRDNYQTYPYDYFSGADCKIFFGDIWVDDVITIQYNVNQSKTPIYGYASQLFDAVARGQVIVEGTLSVAFKETGYLNIIQALLESQRKDAVDIITKKIEQNRVLADQGLVKFVPRLNYIGDDAKPDNYGFSYSPTGSPQIIRQQQTIEQILASKKAGTALSNQMLGAGYDKSRDFEDFAEILEDTIWGDGNGNPLSLEAKLKRADEFDYLSNGGILTAKGKNYANTLNIMLAFGDINDFRAEHTILVLNDVHFVSTGMIVSPAGDPIAETYTFFARDINDSISTEVKTNINPIKLNVGNDRLKLSKLDDIATIEQFLNNNPDQVLLIEVEAALDNFGWNSFQGELELNFAPNRLTPFVDQLCAAVEKAVNDIRVPEVIDASKTQYIVKVLDAGTTNESTPSDITMILEQAVPNTRSYRVISPTRTGFAAPVIITRDDYFTDIKELEKPLDVVKARIDQNRSIHDESVAAALAEKQRINQELTSVGLSDEQKAVDEAIRKREDMIAKAEKDGKISKFEQFRLDRRQQDLDKANVALNAEKDRDIGDRDLTRSERDRLVDLTNSYNATSDTLNKLAKDEQNLINQEERYNSALQEQQRVVREKEAAVAHQQNLDAIEEMRIVDQQQKSTKIASEAASETSKIDEELAQLNVELQKLEAQKILNSSYNWNTSQLNPKAEWISDSTANHQIDEFNRRNTEYGIEKGQTVALDIGTGSTTLVVRSPFAGEVVSVGASSSQIRLNDGTVITYKHQNTDGIKVGDKYEVGTPINLQQIAGPHLHVESNQLSGSELESQVQQNLNLPYKPGVIPTATHEQEQQRIVTEQRKAEALKSMNALNWLNNNVSNNSNPLIFNNESNSDTNNYQSNQSFQDINNDGKINVLDVPVIKNTVIQVTPNLRDLYDGRGANYINVKFVETIPPNSNTAGPQSISEGYKIVRAQTVSPINKQADTADVYIALRNEYGNIINQYDVTTELAHEDAHVQQIFNWTEKKLSKDQNIHYENRPSEIEARYNAIRNSDNWSQQYSDSFKEILKEYTLNK